MTDADTKSGAAATDTTTVPAATTTDRRERRRIKRRDEVAMVAIRLFGERGFHDVTVDEIAAAADIAPRTFFRYFPSKDDVLFTDHEDKRQRLRQMIAASPTDEPILSSVRHAIMALADQYEHDSERMLLSWRVVAETPSLQARAIEHQDAWEEELVEMIAARLDVDPLLDLRTRVVAATTMASLRSALRVWVATDGRTDLVALANQALDLLDGGLQHASDLAGRRRARGRSTVSRSTPGRSSRRAPTTPRR
jgi:AcrR family transcriptional regulator